MTPTIKDVAAKVGVSQSTVSLVLNNRENVSPDTRRKVLQAIEVMDYHPRHSAQHLALHKGGSIGFVMTEQFFSESEPFYTRILLGAEFEAARKGYYTLLGRLREPFDPRKDVPRFLLDRSADGVIVAGKAPVGFIKYIIKKKIPLVLIDFRVPSVQANHVLIDNLNGSLGAVKMLAERGHRRIGFVGGSSNHPSIIERLEGYRQVMAELHENGDEGLNELVYLEEEESSPEIGRHGAAQLLNLDDPVTAIFATNDATAVGCYRAIKEKGLSIPDDVAVVGFDDVQIGLHLDPDLSTVHIFKANMGKEAVLTLMEQLHNPNQPFQTKIIGTELVVRGSSGGERTEKSEYS